MNKKIFFEFKIDELKEMFKDMQRELKVEKMRVQRELSARDILRPKIIKTALRLQNAGWSVRDSIILTAEQLKIDDVYFVELVIRGFHYTNRQKLLFAKNFFIHTLRKKGFKMRDIAFCMDCSEQTIRNYLKMDCIY